MLCWEGDGTSRPGGSVGRAQGGGSWAPPGWELAKGVLDSQVGPIVPASCPVLIIARSPVWPGGREGGRVAGSEPRDWWLAVACGAWLGVWNLDGSLSLTGAASLPACRPRWRHSFGQQITRSAFSLRRIALAIIQQCLLGACGVPGHLSASHILIKFL